MRNLPSVLNSGILVQTDEMNQLASGAGATVNVPFYKDSTDDDDEPQVEDTESTIGKMASGKQVSPVLNRVKAYSASALSAAVSGSDPVSEILSQLAVLFCSGDLIENGGFTPWKFGACALEILRDSDGKLEGGASFLA